MMPPSPLAFNFFPASGFFPMGQLFASGGHREYCSFNFSTVLEMNIQGWFPLSLTDLILQSKGFSGVFFTPQFKSIDSLTFSISYGATLTSIHDCYLGFSSNASTHQMYVGGRGINKIVGKSWMTVEEGWWICGILL